jgi:hypothetical protein
MTQGQNQNPVQGQVPAQGQPAQGQNQNPAQGQPAQGETPKDEGRTLMVDGKDVKEKFISLLKKMHKMDCETAENIYDREAMYYKQAFRGEQKLRNCSLVSCYAAFLEVAILGVSLQPGAKSEAYMEARSGVCYLRISAYGELNLRIRSGQIVRMSNPQVIYEGDHFQPRTNERGDLTVDYRPLIPRKHPLKIIGCYVCIVLPDDGRDFKWLLEDDIDRLKKYSISPTTGKAAANYSKGVDGQIDPGFLEAKTIRHAMRAYTKLRTGDNVAMDDDDDAENTVEVENAPDIKEPKDSKEPESETAYGDLEGIPF